MKKFTRRALCYDKNQPEGVYDKNHPKGFTPPRALARGGEYSTSPEGVFTLPITPGFDVLHHPKGLKSGAVLSVDVGLFVCLYVYCTTNHPWGFMIINKSPVGVYDIQSQLKRIP